MVGLFSPKVYLVKSKIWAFLEQSLAFLSYKLLATLRRRTQTRISNAAAQCQLCGRVCVCVCVCSVCLCVCVHACLRRREL